MMRDHPPCVLVTYEHLAHALGYADRRNVHNFWAEFEACGADLAAFLQRRKKVVFFPTPSICSVAFTPCAPPFAGCGPMCPVVTPADYGRSNSRGYFGRPQSAPCTAAWTRSKPRPMAARPTPLWLSS
jgi:hypothetical protein